MKKLIVKKIAEINELDIEAYNEEVPEDMVKETLQEIKDVIENDEEINKRFWKYIIDYTIKKIVNGEKI